MKNIEIISLKLEEGEVGDVYAFSFRHAAAETFFALAFGCGLGASVWTVGCWFGKKKSSDL